MDPLNPVIWSAEIFTISRSSLGGRGKYQRQEHDEAKRGGKWGGGGTGGGRVTGRPFHFAVSPASLHQIESIFLVDFRSRSRPRYHGHEISRGKSAILQESRHFSPAILLFPTPILYLRHHYQPSRTTPLPLRRESS